MFTITSAYLHTWPTVIYYILWYAMIHEHNILALRVFSNNLCVSYTPRVLTASINRRIELEISNVIEIIRCCKSAGFNPLSGSPFCSVFSPITFWRSGNFHDIKSCWFNTYVCTIYYNYNNLGLDKTFFSSA